MSELSYPKHSHPHGVDDTEPNENRIWVCEECLHIFSDAELRKDKETIWGHICMASPRCKSQRCESHLEPFEPAIKEVL